MTEKEVEEVSSNNTNTEKSKRFKDIQESDDWKAAHLADKKEVEIHRDEWKRKYYDSDRKVVELAKKNLKLTEEIESIERDDLHKRKIYDQDAKDEKQKKEHEKQLSNFLNRIK